MLEFTVISDAVSVVEETGENASINWWMLVAAIEFALILILLFIPKKSRRIDYGEKEKIKKESLSESVDFMNIVNSSFNASVLYDDLKKKCHPDRFVGNKEKMETATYLSLEIAKNKNNIKRLTELQAEAIEKLGI